MKLLKILLAGALLLFALVPSATAGDFAWIRDFNLQAQADLSGFRTNLETRFNLGDVQVRAVLRDFDNPSDAYIALRLGQISGRPIHEVIKRYRAHRRQGWGRIARSLGIKPGSAEFLALKQGQDLEGGSFHKGRHGHGEGHGNKSKGHGRGKGHKKW